MAGSPAGLLGALHRPASGSPASWPGVQSDLDLGCGNGGLTTELARAGFEAVGCDRDQLGIKISASNSGSLGGVQPLGLEAKYGDAISVR